MLRKWGNNAFIISSFFKKWIHIWFSHEHCQMQDVRLIPNKWERVLWWWFHYNPYDSNTAGPMACFAVSMPLVYLSAFSLSEQFLSYTIKSEGRSVWMWLKSKDTWVAMWLCPTSQCRSAGGRWIPARKQSLHRERWTSQWQTAEDEGAAHCWIAPQQPRTTASLCDHHGSLVIGYQESKMLKRKVSQTKSILNHVKWMYSLTHTPPLYSVLLLQSLRSISTVPAITSSSSRASKTDTSLESTTWHEEMRSKCFR